MKNDESWFNQIFAENKGRVFHYSKRFLQGREAEDLVQYAFTKLWETRDKLEIENYRSWLFKIIRNHAIDIFRKRKRELPFEVGRHDLVFGKNLENHVMAKQIHDWLLDLKPEEREVLILKFQEELSYKEIADVTGKTTSSVGVLLHRGILNLQKLSNEEGES